MTETIAAREWIDMPNQRITRLDPIPLPRPIPPSVEGWLWAAEVEWLYQTAQRLKAEGVEGDLLEVGSYRGLSAAALAQAGRLTCVDTFKGGEDLPNADSRPLFDAAMRTMGLSPRVIVGRSQTVLPKLARKTHLKFRMVFIDGSHEYSAALADIRNGWKLLSEGGVLALDDYQFTDVGRAAQRSGFPFVTAIGWSKLFYATKPRRELDSINPHLTLVKPESNPA